MASMMHSTLFRGIRLEQLTSRQVADSTDAFRSARWQTNFQMRLIVAYFTRLDKGLEGE